jgi:two-component system chemotaxis response regulator CheB
MLRLKEAGARTIAQDEKSCVVFGMPKEAIKMGSAEKIVDLDHIGQTSLDLLESS